ncbi:hypothetical protein IGI04_019586 [Brassica rapa subsp. trilocularis]|uniref:Uncharacterized protein n=1 Tax=Brassica rapa subsp. trilocularis TaxID=1813537 RepID=A0ABQ7MG95_BRACM|nr:hypothetical protein IGI04_019586 [Brassica rapa subsp. trilocularis]
MADDDRTQFSALSFSCMMNVSLRGLIHNPCGISCGMISCSDVTEGNEKQKPSCRRAFERNLITYSFLERIGQPAVDEVNERGESVPFVVLAATFILDFSLSQTFRCFSVTHLVHRN